MNQTLFSFLLTLIAGLSTLIGSIVIFINKKYKNTIIVSSLSFASSVMFFISITDLIPESIKMLNNFNKIPLILIILININIGFIISSYIKKYIPDNTDNLYKVGVISMLAIILHNIPEGIATFIAGNTNIHLGISLTASIALHNIPEGISIAVPIYYAKKSKYKAFLYTLISGLSELFGALITYLFLQPLINEIILGILFLIISGIMIHISIFDLLPESKKYKKGGVVVVSYIIGIIFVLLNHILIR